MRSLWPMVLAVLCLSFARSTISAESPWQFYPEGELDYTLLRAGRVYLQLGTHAWGPGWAYFGFSRGATQSARARREYTATATVRGTEQKVRMAHAAEQAGPNSVLMTYELTAPQGAELTQIVVRFDPGGAFEGGKCVAVLPDGSREEVALPFRRGSIGQSVEKLMLVDGGGMTTTIALEPAQPVSMDGEGRLQLAGASLSARKPRRTMLTVTFPEPVRFYARQEDSVQRDETANWFPYPVGPAGVPVDLSFLNKDAEGNYVPAGGHGFLTVDGDRFVFEDGTPARFWGLNVTAGAALGSPERAEQIAERLARLGCNVVRLHHLDSWANPIIDYDHPDGTTQHLSPEGMRALDKTIYELKRHGIYVVLDPWVQRCFKEADGVADYGKLGRRGNFNLHPHIYFDERMQELIRKQWQQFWTHTNEFTGTAYRDEPAVILTEVINEGLLTGLSGVTRPYYRQELLAIYRRWAQRNNGLPAGEAKLFEQNYGRNNISFMMHLHRRFYLESHNFFRSIGVRIPINATNWAHWTWVLTAQTDLDFMDAHHYYGGNRIGPGHGLGGLWLNHAPGLPGGPFGKIAAFAICSKPVTSSECGNNPPKTYRAAYQLGLAAVAAFQGWDGITGYAFSQSGRPRDTLGAFEWETDPASLASVATGALLFRRGDVQPGRRTVALRIPQDDVYELRYQNGGARQFWNTAGFNAAIEQHRVVVVPPGSVEPALDVVQTMTPDEAFEYEPAGTELISDTGEIRRDWQDGVGTIDTARTQVAYGKLGETGRTCRTAECSFSIATPFAVVAVQSLTQAPLHESEHLLVTAVARVQNTGMAFNLARNSIVSKGGPPVIAEPVVGLIQVRTAHNTLVMHPLRADGTRGRAVPLAVREGLASIELTPDRRTIFYEVVAGEEH